MRILVALSYEEEVHVLPVFMYRNEEWFREYKWRVECQRELIFFLFNFAMIDTLI